MLLRLLQNSNELCQQLRGLSVRIAPAIMSSATCEVLLPRRSTRVNCLSSNFHAVLAAEATRLLILLRRSLQWLLTDAALCRA